MPLKVYQRAFISHSYRDKSVADCLHTLLTVSLNVPATSVVCTSCDGVGFQSSHHINTNMRDEIKASGILILLSTKFSVLSEYVNFELGMANALNKKITPLEIDSGRPVRHKSVAHLRHYDLTKMQDVLSFINEVGRRIGLQPIRAEAYLRYVNDLQDQCRRYLEVAYSSSAEGILASIDGYAILSDGSINDQRTGLLWKIGPDLNYTWEEAISWVANSPAYTMPSVDQLRSIFDAKYTAGTGYFKNGRFFPAKMHPVFQGIGGGSWVWSNEDDGDGAIAFNYFMGDTAILPKTVTSYSVRVFAVRPTALGARLPPC